MVVEEFINNNLVRHFSNTGKQLLQAETGVIYEDAIDIVPCRYTYTEVESDELESEEYLW